MAIRVQLGQDEVQVEPGGSAQLMAIIRNEGDQPDHVALEVEGIDTEWCAIPIPSFALAPGEEVQERILFRPPRSVESRAGVYPIIIRARSLENGENGLAQASLVIRPFSMLTLELSPRRGFVSPLSKQAHYEVTVSNLGNTEQTLHLYASDSEEALVFEWEHEQIHLAPGEIRTLLLTVQPRQLPLLTNPTLYSFTITARSMEDPLRTSNTHGELERRGLISSATVVFLLMLALLIGVWVYTRPRPVEIVDFIAEPAQITAGEKTTLHWRVRNADQVMIEPAVGMFDPNKTQSVQVQPSNTTTYRLIARNRYGERTKEVVVIVQNAPEPPPPVITKFFADPPQIRRGESVILRWEVKNATELILTPPGQKLDPLMPGFEHHPSRSTDYVLIARNSAGKIVSKKLRVEVVDPSQAQIVRFVVEPSEIALGESATLRWQVQNAQRVVIDNGIGEVSSTLGEFTITPTATTTYTLTAYDAEGRPSQAKVTVTVRELTPPNPPQ
jgi:hypothetical protein